MAIGKKCLWYASCNETTHCQLSASLGVKPRLDSVQVQHDPNATATDTSLIHDTLYVDFGGITGGGGRGVGGDPRFATDLEVIP